MKKQKKPLVSVLIPVFNVDFYVEEAVRSIQNQTYNNLEIIVIDDGSSDDTYNIVEKLSIKDQRIKLYKNEKNLKIVKTLNKALSLANGEYIARMDGDDISEPDRIEKKVNYLINNPDIDLVGCSLISICPEGNKIKEIPKLSDFELIKKTVRYTSPISHIWLTRKDVYTKLGGYRELSGAEDYDFLLRMLTVGMKFTNIPNYYGYFVRLGRHGNTADTNGLYQKKLHELIYQMYRERQGGGQDSFELEKTIKISILSNIVYRYCNKKFHQASVAYSEKRMLKTAYYLFLSLLSPHMLHGYYLRISYKLILKNNR